MMTQRLVLLLCLVGAAAVASSTAAESSEHTYVAELSNDGVTWKDGEAPAHMPSTADVRAAVETVLLQTYSTAYAGDGAIPIERNDMARCGPAEEGPGWSAEKAKLKLVRAKFKKAYVFSHQVGDIFIGTDGIQLQAFDGTIRVEVKGDVMKLHIHNGGPGAESNVAKSSTRPCAGVNMMTLQVELNKFGFAKPGMTSTAGSDGLHLQEWFGPDADSWGAMATRNTVPSNRYAVKIRIAVEATAHFVRGKWVTTDTAIKKCSPGIEFAGDLAESAIFTKLKSWGVIDWFADVGGMLTNPLYCALKYTIPGLPWLGHIANFCATDTTGKSMMTYTADTQLSNAQRGTGVRNLNFRVGSQLDVPTMPFVAHIIKTAQGMSDELDATDAASGRAKSEAETLSAEESNARILKQLASMGFEPEVLEAMKVIKVYVAKLTRSTAKASAFLTGFFNNLFTLIFSHGNELEAKFRGGIHLGKASAAGLNGDLTGKVADFFVKTTAAATPVYPHLFLLNKEQLEQFTERAVEHGGIDEAVGKDGGFKDDAFTLKGKITLAQCKNVELTGSIKALQVRKKEAEAFLDHPMAQEFLSLLIKLLMEEPVKFDLTTENDLPGATHNDIKINSKRIAYGLKIGYTGPLDITKIGAGIKGAINGGSKALKAAEAEAKKPYAKCYVKALVDSGKAQVAAWTAVKPGKGTCFKRFPIIR